MGEYNLWRFTSSKRPLKEADLGDALVQLGCSFDKLSEELFPRLGLEPV